jgi:hypothetical protein
MTSEMGCEQVRELAPEIVLGICEGAERDAALRHAAGCAGCRRLLSELTSAGDELLLLAPPRDPPPGFESRVLGAVSEPPRRPGFRWLTLRRPQFAMATAAAVLAAVVGGGSVFLATTDERRIANSYQSVLSQGQGSFFAAAPSMGPRAGLARSSAIKGSPRGSW